jgi:hypothetical protein
MQGKERPEPREGSPDRSRVASRDRRGIFAGRHTRLQRQAHSSHPSHPHCGPQFPPSRGPPVVAATVAQAPRAESDPARSPLGGRCHFGSSQWYLGSCPPVAWATVGRSTVPRRLNSRYLPTGITKSALCTTRFLRFLWRANLTFESFMIAHGHGHASADSHKIIAHP